MPFGVATITGTRFDFGSLPAVQDPSHKTDEYARVKLPEEVSKQVVYIKLERTDNLSDTQHSATHPWVEQFTAIREGYEPGFTAVHSTGETGETVQGFSEDLGYILTFHGTFSGTRAIDENNREVLTEEQATLRETMFNTRFPRARQFDFRLHEVIKTDGPPRRRRVTEAAESQAAHAQEQMFKKQEEFFAKLLGMIQGAGGQMAPAGSKTLQEQLSDAMHLIPEQKDALSEYAREEAGVTEVELQTEPASPVAMEPPKPLPPMIKPRIGRPPKE